MSTFHKHPLQWIFLLCVAILLPGCQPFMDKAPDQAAPPEEGKKKLRLAVQSTVNSPALASLIKRYNDTHADHQIELMSLPRERYDETLNMLITSGQSPDLFQASPGWLSTYIAKNWLMDLSKIAEPELLATYPKWAVDYTKENNHFYAIPSEMMTLRLLYNKDLFQKAGLNPEKAPQTLQELKEYAGRISLAGTGYRIYGFALPAGEIDTYRLAMETASTSSGLYYFDFVNGRYNFDLYRPWFETMLAMKREQGLFPGETAQMTETALNQFSEGNVGMMYATNREYARLVKTGGIRFPVGIARPPLVKLADRGKGALMVAIQHPFVISSATAYSQEAVQVWHYLHSREFLTGMYEQQELIPIRQDVAEAAPMQASSWLHQFLPEEDESPYPREPKIIVSRNSSDAVRMNAYSSIMQAQQSPVEALKRLTELYNQNLDDAVYKNWINPNDYKNPLFNPRSPMEGF